MSRVVSGLSGRRAVMMKLELLLVLATIFLLSHITEASSRGGFGISGHLHSNDAKDIALIEIHISIHSSSDVPELSESRSRELIKEVTGEEAQQRPRLLHPSSKVADCLKKFPSDLSEVLLADDGKDDPKPGTPSGVTGGVSQTESHPSSKVADCLKNAPLDLAEAVPDLAADDDDDPTPPTPVGTDDLPADGEDDDKPGTPFGVTGGASQTKSLISLLLQQSWI